MAMDRTRQKQAKTRRNDGQYDFPENTSQSCSENRGRKDPQRRRGPINARGYIRRLQIALGRAGYDIRITQSNTYGKGRVFILYTVRDPEGNKLISTYRPHEVTQLLSDLLKRIQSEGGGTDAQIPEERQ